MDLSKLTGEDKIKYPEKLKLTGNPNVDFPEFKSNEFDNINELEASFEKYAAEREKENEYIKKNIIEEVVENVEVKLDRGIYDKRLRRPLLKRILEAIFGDDRI